MLYAHAGGAAGETQEDGMIREGDIDALMMQRRGYVRQVVGNGVYIVWEVGGNTGGGSGKV